MILHRDVEYEERLRRISFLVHLLQELVIEAVADETSQQNVFARILFVYGIFEIAETLVAVSVFVDSVVIDEGFDAVVALESKQRIIDIPLPARPVVDVQGGAGIILRCQRVRQRRQLTLDIELICIAACGEERHGISRKELKFGVARSRSGDRHIEISLDSVFRQAARKRHVVLIRGELSENPQIGERLIHDTDNVRSLILFLAGGSCGLIDVGSTSDSQIGVEPGIRQRIAVFIESVAETVIRFILSGCRCCRVRISSRFAVLQVICCICTVCILCIRCIRAVFFGVLRLFLSSLCREFLNRLCRSKDTFIILIFGEDSPLRWK